MFVQHHSHVQNDTMKAIEYNMPSVYSRWRIEKKKIYF